MNMKKISCAVIFAAASISVVLAAEEAALLTPSASPATAAGAPMAAGGPAGAGGPASGPTSDASSILPAFGTLVGASLVSLFGYYFQ
ncbi:hypothetical protein LINGRAHAP2_LOCUS20175 [Linum grandiflorum]